MMHFLLQAFLRRLIVNPPATLRAALLLTCVLLYGTSGFLYFELPGNPDLVWSDALWYSLVTLTTVGYGDFFPKSAGGRFLVGVPLMLIGIGLLGYILSTIAMALITARNKELKGMSRFAFSRHIVIIHYPGPTKLLRLLDEISGDPAIERGTEVVLIDPRLEELPEELAARRIHYVRGDPARDETLQRAGIDRASHAVIFTRDPADPAADAINVTVALAVEGRAHKVNTVVECLDPGTEELLRKAGCDRVVCSARFDALYVSQELLNPGMQDVVGDLLSNHGGQQFYLTPIHAAAGATVADLAAAAEATGHILLGLRRQQSNLLNPSPDLAINSEDQALSIGAERQERFAPGTGGLRAAS